MKKGLWVIVLLLILVYTTSIVALELDMSQIIEIDNYLSKNKARNTSNLNVIEAEQNNAIYLHYIKECKISGIFYKDSGGLYANVEVYTHNDFKKNKNTLMIYPRFERDFPVDFNCTEKSLTIKSLPPSEFNEIKSITPEEVTKIVEKSSNESVGKIISFINVSDNDSDEKLENLTKWTEKQDENDRINNCKEKWKFPIRFIEILIGLGLFGNINEKYRRIVLKAIKKHKIIYLTVIILLIIFVGYFEFGENPFFCKFI